MTDLISLKLISGTKALSFPTSLDETFGGLKSAISRSHPGLKPSALRLLLSGKEPEDTIHLRQEVTKDSVIYLYVQPSSQLLKDLTLNHAEELSTQIYHSNLLNPTLRDQDHPFKRPAKDIFDQVPIPPTDSIPVEPYSLPEKEPCMKVPLEELTRTCPTGVIEKMESALGEMPKVGENNKGFDLLHNVNQGGNATVYDMRTSPESRYPQEIQENFQDFVLAPIYRQFGAIPELKDVLVGIREREKATEEAKQGAFESWRHEDTSETFEKYVSQPETLANLGVEAQRLCNESAKENGYFVAHKELHEAGLSLIEGNLKKHFDHLDYSGQDEGEILKYQKEIRSRELEILQDISVRKKETEKKIDEVKDKQQTLSIMLQTILELFADSKKEISELQEHTVSLEREEERVQTRSQDLFTRSEAQLSLQKKFQKDTKTQIQLLSNYHGRVKEAIIPLHNIAVEERKKEAATIMKESCLSTIEHFTEAWTILSDRKAEGESCLEETRREVRNLQSRKDRAKFLPASSAKALEEELRQKKEEEKAIVLQVDKLAQRIENLDAAVWIQTNNNLLRILKDSFNGPDLMNEREATKYRIPIDGTFIVHPFTEWIKNQLGNELEKDEEERVKREREIREKEERRKLTRATFESLKELPIFPLLESSDSSVDETSKKQTTDNSNSSVDKTSEEQTTDNSKEQMDASIL